MALSTVLVVDDNEDLGLMFRDILEYEGYESHYAASGEKALEMLNKIPPPSIILVDCNMPGMNGEEFVRRLKQEHPTLCERAFILGFSSHESVSESARQFESIADGYAEKPWDVNSFLKLIRNIKPKAGSSSDTL